MSLPLDAMSAMRHQQSLAERCRVYKTLVPSLQLPTEDKRQLETAFDHLRTRLAPQQTNGMGAFAGEY